MEQALKKEVFALRDKYGRGGKYLVDGEPRYNAHAVILEEKYGLKGIASRYKTPNNEPHNFVEYKYRKEFLKYALAIDYIKKHKREADENKYDASVLIAGGSKNALVKVNKEIDKFKELNPSLKELKYDKNNFIESYRALTGITSQYNVDDINYYISTIDKSRKDDKRDALMEHIKNKGISLGFTPSNKTLVKIKAQLDIKQNMIFLKNIAQKTR